MVAGLPVQSLPEGYHARTKRLLRLCEARNNRANMTLRGGRSLPDEAIFYYVAEDCFAPTGLAMTGVAGFALAGLRVRSLPAGYQAKKLTAGLRISNNIET